MNFRSFIGTRCAFQYYQHSPDSGVHFNTTNTHRTAVCISILPTLTGQRCAFQYYQHSPDSGVHFNTTNIQRTAVCISILPTLSGQWCAFEYYQHSPDSGVHFNTTNIQRPVVCISILPTFSGQWCAFQYYQHSPDSGVHVLQYLLTRCMQDLNLQPAVFMFPKTRNHRGHNYCAFMRNKPDEASIPATCPNNLIPKLYILQLTAISILGTQ